MTGRLVVVVGGQYGSEAKGHVTAQLVRRALGAGERVLNIRVGGPNAGHTVIGPDGNRWPLRHLPVGVAYLESAGAGRLELAIAQGSEVDLDVLADELATYGPARAAGSWLMVDGAATVLTVAHRVQEADEGLRGRLGSTAKGIGAARAARVWRTAETVRVAAPELPVGDVARRAAEALEEGWTVVVEGVQGYGLGLHSPSYPFCTSIDCTAVDMLALAGISPWQVRSPEIWMVVRPYPIRVAGNSGPMASETTWEALGLAPEQTTVTKLQRRVGGWDPDLVRAAARANMPTHVALMMYDQVRPEIAGRTSWVGLPADTQVAIGQDLDSYAQDMAPWYNRRIRMVGTGPNSVVM